MIWPFQADPGPGHDEGPVEYRLLRALFGSLREAAFVIDHGSRTILACNPQAERVCGWAADQTIGRETSIFHVDTAHFETFGSRSRTQVANGAPFHARFWMRRADGSCVPSENTVTPLQDARGREIAVSLVRDLSWDWDEEFARGYARLTRREQQVFAHSARGQSAKEIARALSLSHRTIELHRARILEKFDVRAVPQLLTEIAVAGVARQASVQDRPCSASWPTAWRAARAKVNG